MKGGSSQSQSMASSELGLNRISELSNPTPRQALLEVGGQRWSVGSPNLLFLPTGCQSTLLSSKVLWEQTGA